MGGIKKKLRLAAPKTKQKKALNRLKSTVDSSLITKTKGPAKPRAVKSDRKQKKEPKGTKDATREPINFVSPATPVDDSSEEMESEDDEQQQDQQEKATKKLPVIEPVPTDVPDPKLPPALIKMLRPLIGYFYNGDQISLKQSFEQAVLLLEPDYDESTKVFRFLVNTKEVCRAVGEKNEAHSEARDKLVQIVRYYCYNLKKVKPYHTRRKIFYTRPPKSVQAKEAAAKSNQLQDENIGFKMLQKQGWSGGGLGSGESGITEPITATKRKGKHGLGMENATQEVTGEETAKVKIPLEAFYLVIQEYAGVNALYDLVFSSQFPKGQVRKLRDFALRKKLLTQMVGQKKKKLVVSKPLTIKEIKVGVMKGHSDLCAKYVVVPPAAGIPREDLPV
ncbi:NF-kappa-B-repressing factor-like [Anopheles bellator]|uniref:NF-kappa-B-repressing factor-like n=1 Tax=Anopheles bellator TaxID=139047 RepID=UPI00264A1FFE|nr:NF-kappa-B-repressing factor-like [Anopheles bellator]